MPPQTTPDTRTDEVRNMTGEPRELPIMFRTIQPGESVTLPAPVAQRLAEQPGWDLVTPGKPTAPTDKSEE
ncbi:hypothetical protein EV192_11741 [Actinocrispum wychmicini]|uniref:Uncharacterized protein n=2 Tax=Actinocrispum wychmicini TaxID=1213861 RepID=A0A4R2IPQ7_9PSEU|nr:hypothetical protein EV192_11741 [Actinocrispum wychmicini]